MYINVNTTIGNTDNETITNAVRKAKENGINKVIIPKHNDRTDSDLWVIEDTIYLPNDIEILVDDAHLMLADNVYCNMFANASVSGTKDRTLADEQYGITIRGEGNAVLDGGKYNSLSERNSEKDGRPHISKNTTVLFVNCRNVTVENISIINQRWWGITNIFVRDSYFGNLCIRSDYSRFADGVHYPGEEPRNYDEIYIKNSDGIDLRVGCNNILIENITGYAEDDMIALTALGIFEKRLGYYVSDKDDDISDVTIKNITVRNVVSKCKYGVALYNELCNIKIENVTAIKGVALAAPEDEVCTVYGLETNNLRTMEDPAKVRCGEIIVK